MEKWTHTPELFLRKHIWERTQHDVYALMQVCESLKHLRKSSLARSRTPTCKGWRMFFTRSKIKGLHLLKPWHSWKASWKWKLEVWGETRGRNTLRYPIINLNKYGVWTHLVRVASLRLGRLGLGLRGWSGLGWSGNILGFLFFFAFFWLRPWVDRLELGWRDWLILLGRGWSIELGTGRWVLNTLLFWNKMM